MLLQNGIYVIEFFFTVLAKGKARIGVQLAVTHDIEHLNGAGTTFA